MTGGLTKGDLASIVGRPSRGKTWQLLHAALFQWFEAGQAKIADPKADLVCEHSRLIISMEMPVEQIRQRLAAMVTHVPAMKLKHAELSTTLPKKLKSGLTEIKGFGAPLWIVNGNLASTVEDIWIRARQLKPDAILIDGAYLLKHPTEKDRYKRVAENAELIKRELSPLAPTIASWQFAKSASAKKLKKTGGEATLDDIGYTDAIAQVSSIVLGLLEADTIETLNQRTVSVLKGRGGEIGKIVTHFDADKMLFGEIEEESIEELQFVQKSCNHCNVAIYCVMSKKNRRGAWWMMIDRCTNPKSEHWGRYGGRGITVCMPWQISFEKYYSDTGEPPGPGMTLDREDNDGPYSPDNCIWSTRASQARNRDYCHQLTWQGKTQTASEWARELGLKIETVIWRVKKGWPIKKIMTTGNAYVDAGLTFRGKTQTFSAWGRDLGLTGAAITVRLKAGWSLEKALTTPKHGA